MPPEAEKSPPRTRGRPELVPTAKMRRQVAIAAGAGMKHEDIAIGLGITDKTLRKHFRLELTAGAAAKRMEVLTGLYLAAKRGSAAAAKSYLAHTPEARPYAPKKPASEPDRKPESSPPPGKKEMARRRAAAAGAPGSKYAPSAPPRLVANNGVRS